jgi:phosphatidylethanolamine/phosphatidyl-N-methylethanolamine N-methyltransferase
MDGGPGPGVVRIRANVLSRWNTPASNRVRYSVYAPVYDWFTAFRRGRERAVELLALKPEEQVLVVGAGTGRDLEHLPDHVQVVAGDIAPGMLRRLRRRAERWAPRVRVRELDAHRLDCPDGSFDAALLHLIVAVVPDPRACLSEAARVTRVGGRISVFDKFAPEGMRPAAWRRILNPLAEALATSIDRQLEPLLEGLPLRVVRREPAGLGGFFEVVLLERIADRPPATRVAT